MDTDAHREFMCINLCVSVVLNILKIITARSLLERNTPRIEEARNNHFYCWL